MKRIVRSSRKIGVEVGQITDDHGHDIIIIQTSNIEYIGVPAHKVIETGKGYYQAEVVSRLMESISHARFLGFTRDEIMDMCKDILVAIMENSDEETTYL